jgi:hypothetical protein
VSQNLRPNGHKFPYETIVCLKNFPEDLGIVKNYSSGKNMPTLVWVEFKRNAYWCPEEDLILAPANPSRRDSY